MNRLLLAPVLGATLLLVIPAPLPAQDDPGSRGDRLERARGQVERNAERVQERLQRLQDRVRDRAARVQDRVEGRIERGFDDHDGGAHIMFGRDYELGEGHTATEAVVVFGGDATINGHAQDDVVVVGGTLRLGPEAVVDGDVSLVGAELQRDPSARVNGEIDVVHVNLPWTWVRGWSFPDPADVRWQGAALAFTIGRMALVLFLSVLLVVIAPRWITSIAAQLAHAPATSTIAGFAAEILFAPALALLAVTLVITIVGIPLLAGIPLLVAAFALVWVAGYAAVAGVVGSRLRGKDWQRHGLRGFDVLIGSCLLGCVTLFGQALMVSPGGTSAFALLVRGTGWMVEYLAWTVALGAALTAWRRSDGFRRGTVPPVIPPVPTPSPTAM